MKSHRGMLIDSLIDSVDDWSLEQLIDWVKQDLLKQYKVTATYELAQIYVAVFGAEDYANTMYDTFPEGYNEQ